MPEKIDVLKLPLNGAVEIDDVQVTEEKDFYFEPVKDFRFLLYLKNRDSNSVDVTVKAGDYFQKLKLNEDNDAEFEGIAENEAYMMGPFESARFKDKDGKINILVETDGTAGTDEDVDIAVIELG